MLDFPVQDGSDRTWVFQSPNTSGDWQMWVKPRGCSFVHIFCLGGGGGGGGGFTGAAGTARGGGAGGGTSAWTRLTKPACILPDVLWVQVGLGGAGGAASTNGSSGTNSFVSVQPDGNTYNLLCTSGANPGVGGNAGTSSGTAAGGAAGTTATIANAAFMLLGNFVSTAGRAGATGGVATGGAGGAGAMLASSINATGSGGGGTGTANTNFAGGTCSVASGLIFYPTIAGGIAAGGRGNDGGFIRKPFTLGAGTGGGSNGASGVGGSGGNGGISCGGGGGGGGVTGGKGGNGGSGLVIISVC